MTALATIGHNMPPDPIEAVISNYGNLLSEIEHWTDGELVENEEQMRAVDELLKQFRTYQSDLQKAGKERTDPLHKAWKEEVAAVKIYTEDADRIKSALVASVAPFKAKLVAQKEAEKRAAFEEAERIRREAEAKASQANAADLDAQREAAAAREAAMEAENAARRQARETVKGMRTVTHYEVTDVSDLLRWINANDRAALDAFAEDYARKHHKDGIARPGLRVWQTKEAY